MWVKPPSGWSAKFETNARKGMFLGCSPIAIRNFLWHDCLTDEVKIATHGRFDEGFSDLPLDQIPSDVNHLLRSEGGDRSKLSDATITSADELSFHVYPCSTTFVGAIPKPCTADNC